MKDLESIPFFQKINLFVGKSCFWHLITLIDNLSIFLLLYKIGLHIQSFAI